MNEKKESFIPKDIILFKSVSIVEKYNFFEYLSIMIDAWVPVSEALSSVKAKVRNPFFKIKIDEFIAYISSWDSFSKSMKKMPQVFDTSEISIIESWETIGKLSLSLAKLSEDLKKIHNLRLKIKSALTYPSIIFAVLIMAIVVVLTYVIPQISQLFFTSEVELPFATKALIATSDFIINQYHYIIFFLIIWTIAFIWYKNSVEWKKTLDRITLKIPLVWPVYKNYILALISSNIWTLIWSWIWVIKTLSLVWKSTNNVVYEGLFDEIIVKVSSWSKIVDSMQEIDKENIYFPPDFIQMLWVWEKTANLEEISVKINNQYMKEVDYSLWNLTKWIEPIALLIAWVFVLWFAFSIFGSILKLTDTVK